MQNRPAEPTNSLTEAQRGHLVTLIDQNESAEKPQDRINIKAVRNAESYPFTLLRLNEADGPRYLPKIPHPQRDLLTGANAKLSWSNQEMLVSETNIDQKSAKRFIKSLRESDNFTIDQIHRSIHATQLMYPNTRSIQTAPSKFLLIMEYFDGCDLIDFVSSDQYKLLGFENLHDYALQFYHQLRRLHQEFQLLHGDLKPENLMLSFTPKQVKLIDFDFVTEIKNSHLSSGSRLYGAPELFQSTKNSVASDVYSFGMVLFILYTGEKGLASLQELEKNVCQDLEQGKGYRRLMTFKEWKFNQDFIQRHLPVEQKALAKIIANLCDPRVAIRLQQWSTLQNDLTTIKDIATESKRKAVITVDLVVESPSKKRRTGVEVQASNRAIEPAHNPGFFVALPEVCASKQNGVSLECTPKSEVVSSC